MTEAEARVGTFWDWAVAVYAKPGVAEACLDMQDAHGQNVPLLLWAAWAVVSGYQVDDALAIEAAAVAQVWGDEVVGPLRGIRRRMKMPLTPQDTQTRLTLREKIKAAELQAERALMSELERLVSDRNLKKYDLNQTLKSAVAAAMVRVAGAGPGDALQMAADGLAEALIK